MLSVTTEKRVRLSNNPSGAAWSKDENKFGQKLMEKMGWTKGKGLGANEDGMTEHVKVSLKSDKKGIGCTQQHANKWLDLQDDYEAILATMNNSNSSSGNKNCQSQDDNKKDFIPLAQKSQNTKSRVHYSRFARGKDLSTKAEKDLDCVFGTRAKREEKTTSKKTDEPTTVESIQKVEFGVITTTSTTNVKDYFAQKMAAMKRDKNMTGKSEELSLPQVSQEAEFKVITTTSTANVNIHDYFAQKMAAMRRAKSDTQLMKICQETEEVVHPKFCDDTNILTVNCVKEELVLEKLSSKKKKKKERKHSSEVKFTVGGNTSDNSETLQIGEAEETFLKKEESSKEVKETQENQCEQENSSSRKSKKQKRKRKGDEEQFNSREIASTDSVKPKKQKRNKEIDKMTENSHENESTKCVSSKKRTRSKGLEETQETPCRTENTDCVSSRKRKRSRQTEETQETKNTDCTSSNKRKRKKH